MKLMKSKNSGKINIYSAEQYSLGRKRTFVAISGGIVSAVVLSFSPSCGKYFSEKGGITGKHLS